MSLTRTRTRRHLSITSLIDVIFLLLLFFMLASTFTKFAELEIAGTGSAGQALAAPSQVMQLIVDEAGLSLDGRSFVAGDLAEAITQKLDGTQALSLQVTRDTSSQRLTDILVILEPVDRLQVTMVGPS